MPVKHLRWNVINDLIFKGAATDMRYFARSKFFRSYVHKKNFWLDVTSSFQVRIRILSREVGYLF